MGRHGVSVERQVKQSLVLAFVDWWVLIGVWDVGVIEIGLGDLIDKPWVDLEEGKIRECYNTLHAG
jgi:hypothetical protein